jgi:protein TonB
MLSTFTSAFERFRARYGRRGVALVLALAIEALVLFLFIFLAPPIQPKKPEPKVSVFGVASEGDDASQKSENKKQNAREAKSGKPVQSPSPIIVPPPPAVVVPPPSNQQNFLRLNTSEMAASDISKMPKGAGSAGAGSADSGETGFAGGDSDVMGKGPHGEPLYAAEWYTRPTHQQLNTYIPDRTRTSGYGLIACKTAPNYRVVDCQEISQTPGSGLAGAVRQAAWQFKVRPPRKGGKALIGAWVGIRIDYTIDRIERPSGDRTRYRDPEMPKQHAVDDDGRPLPDPDDQ